MRKVILALAALLLPLCGVSSAAFTFFTDFASFDAATDTTLVEDFEAVATGPYTAPPSFTSNGITFTALPANPNLYVAPAGFTNFGIVGPTTSAVLTASGFEAFEIDLSAVAETAVGFDAYLNFDGAVTTRYYGSTDNLIHTIVDGRGPGEVRFLGVLADEPIYRITWESAAVTAQNVNTGIDNIRLGEARVPPIPAPGAILLGTFGTGLVGWLRRRKAL